MCTCLTEFDEEAYKEGLLEEGMEIGREQGREAACMENAKNLFMNSVSYELVRNSIKDISDEMLLKIYNEVMDSKNA